MLISIDSLLKQTIFEYICDNLPGMQETFRIRPAKQKHITTAKIMIMTYLIIGFAAFSVATWYFVIRAMHRAPTDRELWGKKID